MTGPTPDPGETLGEALRRVRDQLRAANIEAPDLEAELLLRQALRSGASELPSKAWLLARLDQPAVASALEMLAALTARRLAHEPAAYLTGTRNFYGLDFEVTPDVLIPRPETELLVAESLAIANELTTETGGSSDEARHEGNLLARRGVEGEDRRAIDASRSPWTDSPPLRRRGGGWREGSSPLIADVGTGSGAIAIAIAKQLPAAIIVATDISWPALDVARRNARRHGVERRIAFRHGDLLLPVDSYVDLIVANLPYIPQADWRALEPEVRDHEPPIALAAGTDGLDLIRSLLRQAPRYLRPGGAVCLEFGFGQAEAIDRLARAAFPGATVQVFDDFAGIPRVLTARLPRP